MKYLHLLIIAVVVVAGIVAVSPATFAATDPFKQVCDIPGTSDADACQPKPGDKNPIGGTDGILMTVTNTVSLFAGITAVIVIIIAGMQFVLAGGDSTKIANARKAIIYAIVGIIAIIAARSVIAFVITEL
jgi:Type IV secretion system pilin